MVYLTGITFEFDETQSLRRLDLDEGEVNIYRGGNVLTEISIAFSLHLLVVLLLACHVALNKHISLRPVFSV